MVRIKKHIIIGAFIILLFSILLGLSYFHIQAQSASSSKTSISIYNRPNEVKARIALKTLEKNLSNLSDPTNNSLQYIYEKVDNLGYTHVYYQQTYRGVRVVGGQNIVAIDKHNEVKNVVKNIRNISGINTSPTKASSEPVNVIRANHQNMTDVTIKNPELVIMKMRTGYKLVWIAESYDKNGLGYIVVTDAHTNAVYRNHPNYRTIDRDIFQCIPDYGGSPDCIHGSYLGNIYGRVEAQTTPPVDPDHGETLDEVDHLFDHLAVSHNYYAGKFSLNGANNQGGIGDDTIPTKTSGLVYYNHYDSGSCPGAWYSAHPGYVIFCRYLAESDVVAHEYQHAVNHYGVPGGLVYQLEPGALDEAYADIFAMFIEIDSTGTTNWQMGDTINPLAGMSTPLRRLDDPTLLQYSPGVSYPDRFYADGFYCLGELEEPGEGNDYGGVHINMTVLGKGAYLMATGGSFNGCNLSGISGADLQEKAEKIEQILYRALSTKFTSTQSFNQTYTAINTSCDELVGQFGITTIDCIQVERVLQAIELDQPGACSVTPRVEPACTVDYHTPTPSPTPLIYIEPQIGLGDRTDNANPYQIMVFGTDNVLIEKVSGTTNSSGTDNVGSSIVVSTPVNLYLKPRFYLSQRASLTLDVGTNPLVYSNAFYCGDIHVSHDDVINSLDYAAFVNFIWTDSTDADFNLDGVVNSIDYALFARNFLREGHYLIDKGLAWPWTE